MKKLCALAMTSLLAMTGIAVAGSPVDLGGGVVHSGQTLTLQYEGHISPNFRYSMDCDLVNLYPESYPLTISEWNWDPSTWGGLTLDGKDTTGHVMLTPGAHKFHVWMFDIQEKNVHFTNYRQAGKESAAVQVSCTATPYPN